MDNICQYVGAQIKFYRKRRSLTLSEFASMINKSTSTVSKYENGSISIDILTLSEIASSLEVTLEQLLPSPHDRLHISEREVSHDYSNYFMSQDIFYVYYYLPLDHSTGNKVVSVSVLEITRNENAPDSVVFYNECYEPDKNYKNCKYIYNGTMLCYDFVAYFLLENRFHVGAHDYICAKVPFTRTNTTAGIYAGLSESLRNPASTKIIISKSLLTINDELIENLSLFDKEVTYFIKKKNTVIVR